MDNVFAYVCEKAANCQKFDCIHHTESLLAHWLHAHPSDSIIRYAYEILGHKHHRYTNVGHELP